MNGFIIKLVHRWLMRHKMRYLLSWVSFVLISILLVTVYSIGAQLQDGLVNSFFVNPLNYQIRVSSTMWDYETETFLHDMTEKRISSLAEETGATDVRIFYDCDLYLFSIDGKETGTDYEEVVLYDSASSLIMKQESAYLEYFSVSDSDFGFTGRISGKMENSVAVTAELLEKFKISEDGALGKEIVLADKNGNFYVKKISAVLTAKSQIPAFGAADIYLPCEADKIYDYPGAKIRMTTLEYAEDTKMSPIVDILNNGGYDFIMPDNYADTVQDMKTSIEGIGTFIGVLLLLLTSFGLVNSILVTVHENLPFISFMRLIGLNNGQYSLTILYMSGLQGVIGGVLGCVFTIALQSVIPQVIKWLNIDSLGLLNDFAVSYGACFIVIALCTVIATVSGLFTVASTRKNITVHSIYGIAE